MLFYPNVKINLGLRIVGKRPDGYHNLESVFIPVKGLTDILEVVPKETDSFTVTGLSIAGNQESNLVYKALKLVRQEHPINGCHIQLHKLLPMGAGLGGGSADGAFALLALNQVFKLGYSIAELEAKAAVLGSDCPFFIQNIPARVSGRGEVIEPIDEPVLPKDLWISIVHPKIHISTQEAFAGINLSKTFPEAYPLPITLGYNWEAWKHFYQNHFQEGAANAFPALQELLSTLAYLNPESFVSMTGSGSACYQISTSPTDLSRFKAKNYFVWQGKL